VRVACGRRHTKLAASIRFQVSQDNSVEGLSVVVRKIPPSMLDQFHHFIGRNALNFLCSRSVHYRIYCSSPRPKDSPCTMEASAGLFGGGSRLASRRWITRSLLISGRPGIFSIIARLPSIEDEACLTWQRQSHQLGLQRCVAGTRSTVVRWTALEGGNGFVSEVLTGRRCCGVARAIH
jgi:hypothetical protein